jgi:hypothetical protein
LFRLAGALTETYAAALDGAAEEIARAEAAQAAAKHAEAHSALLRSLANINTVVVDLFELGPEPDR